MFDTPTPSAAQMVEDAKLKNRLIDLGRRQQETAELLRDQHLTDAQISAEQFQAISNALAEERPLYAAARAASANFLVVPLAPGSTEPLVDPREATNDPETLFEWWSKDDFKDANIGVALGRVGGILALQVNGIDAYVKLRDMAKVVHPGVDDGLDSVPSWTEIRELGGYSVRLVKSSPSVSMRSVIGWSGDFKRAVNKRLKEDAQRQPQTFFLVWSFPSVTSGNDAFNYRSRKVGEGLTLLAEGDVLPWQGSILEGHPEGDNVQVVAPMSKPPEVPLWLGAMLGRPRSRKEMAAAREVYEAVQRRDSAHVIARIAATRHFEDEARAKAEEDRAKAEKVLADEMVKG